jgi:hypothetical protein
MIAKHVAMRTLHKSGFDALVRYITDEQAKNERVGCVAVTNCHSDRLEAAILEVLNTQAQNTRSGADKTYHLILSFRPGEQPGEATLKAIEARICDGLGFGEHQRVSAVHHDTDNLHMHIAINKIHPIRYTTHEPYYPHKKLARLCEKLEVEFSLERDNHIAHKVAAENRAQDMERHAGVESLLGWVKRECAADMQAAPSWEALHQVMRDNGLELRERGNGLVIQAVDGLAVKASSIDRELSKARLEERLGIYEPSAEHLERAAQAPSRQYAKQPVRSRINTAELYATYKTDQLSISSSRTVQWGKARAKKDRLMEAAKRSGRLKRSAIKLMTGAGVGKKIMYLATSKTLRAEIDHINKQYLKERQEIHEKYQRRAWADWLRARAEEGDQQALAALRARQAAQELQGNTVAGAKALRRQASPAGQGSVTKKGVIIYRVGPTAIRDDGERLKVSPGADPGGMQAALRMAMDRFGERIRVNGTAAFKEQIAQAAASSKLPITFDDAALERRRQELLTPTAPKENAHDSASRTKRTNGADRGRADSHSDGRTGHAATGVNAASGRPVKPNVGRIGRKPPPQSHNRLRSLSELGVVHLASGGEMLLPRDVPRDVEQPRAQPADSVRRDIPGPGRITAAQVAAAEKDIAQRSEVQASALPWEAVGPEKITAAQAADKYIAERNEKRLRIFDIEKHARYNKAQAGLAAFVGIRQVEGHLLALLKGAKGAIGAQEVMVLPVDEPTARRLKRLGLGSAVTVSPQGYIQAKGRSR